MEILEILVFNSH